MRNRALHDALRRFALEAAALLTDDEKAGAELEFELVDEGTRNGPSLFHYRPLVGNFISERWPRLRELESCGPAAETLGAGASAWLQAGGLRGAQAEPALQAMLERLYEDATSFGFPEERFERVYGEVEHTLYRDTVGCSVIAGLPGLELESDRIDLGDGLSIARAGTLDPPVEDGFVCVLERDLSPEDEGPADEARERFARLVAALRLFKAGGVSLASFGWQRTGSGRWTPVELGGTGATRGAPLFVATEEEEELREFLGAFAESPPAGPVLWALERFGMGCSRRLEAHALSDYLLALRALLDPAPGTGGADLGLRLAALCAEEGQRRWVQRRVELALTLERYVMRGGRGQDLSDWIGGESPRALVDELERHTRALLRDVVCGYLDADLKSLADDILLEAESPPTPAPAVPPEPVVIEARDLRAEAETTEWDAVEEDEPAAEAPVGPRFEHEQPEGVTPSADWDEFSAPV